MTNQEKKIEDHPLIVMNQDGEVNLTATIKAAKKDVLTSLLERGPNDDQDESKLPESDALGRAVEKSIVLVRNVTNQEWRNLINLMITECK